MVLSAGDLVGSEDGDHAGQGFGSTGVHSQDASVGILAAQHRGVQHPLEVEVGSISRLARDLCPGVGARDRAANSNQRAFRRRELRRRALCRSLNRLDDSSVAGAAAEVAFERVFDLLVAGMGIGIKQGFGGHDHPRRTEAALHRPVLNEGLLQRMQLAILGQPLNGFHPRSIGATGLEDAGAYCLAIHDDRAGPAVALAAAILGPCEMSANFR